MGKHVRGYLYYYYITLHYITHKRRASQRENESSPRENEMTLLLMTPTTMNYSSHKGVNRLKKTGNHDRLLPTSNLLATHRR